MMIELNNATKIQTIINTTFFARDFHSLPCQVSMIYTIPLYNIIVTDNAIVSIKRNLVTLTIAEFLPLIVFHHTCDLVQGSSI